LKVYDVPGEVCDSKMTSRGSRKSAFGVTRSVSFKMKPHMQPVEFRTLEMSVPLRIDELVISSVNVDITVEKRRVPGRKRDQSDGISCSQSGLSGRAESSSGFIVRP
jgi:hypothetical protein